VKRTSIWQGRIVELELLDDRWEVVRHASAVAIAYVRPEDGYLLGVEQRRPAVDAVTWELPAGLIDPGETAAAAAARELREEANLCGELHYVTQLYVSPGFTDEAVHLFELHDATPCAGVPDETEALTVVWRDPLEVWTLVASGILATSGVTLLGVQRALARRGTGGYRCGSSRRSRS